MPESASQNAHQADLESLLRERIAAGLAGDVSSRSLAAIATEETRSPIFDDGLPKRV
jgi:hypothetical protein